MCIVVPIFERGWHQRLQLLDSHEASSACNEGSG